MKSYQNFISLIIIIITILGFSQNIQVSFNNNLQLANRILENFNYTIALNLSNSLLIKFNAGTSYPQYWIRDINTFIEVALKNVKQSEAREVLLKFLKHQQLNGTIVDGFEESLLKVKLFKNSVETDQETSMIQAIYKYIQLTNDTQILSELVDGKTVLERLRICHEYLLNYKFNSNYGLMIGATTIDWGDIQPEDDPGAIFNNLTHPAIDIYDNAMWVIAINNLIEMTEKQMPIYSRYLKSFLSDLKTNIKKHLWDEAQQKYRPHIYLEKGSPFDSSFNEDQIYYLGGTTIACQAGLHEQSQILQILKQMEDRVVQAGDIITIGMTVFPPYPRGVFVNPHVGHEYQYQNSGDWTWFGGRMVQTLFEYGYIEEADKHLTKMVKFVARDNDYNEWYDQQGIGKGSWQFHGSAGVIGKAILMLQKWALEQISQSNQ